MTITWVARIIFGRDADVFAGLVGEGVEDGRRGSADVAGHVRVARSQPG